MIKMIAMVSSINQFGLRLIATVVALDPVAGAQTHGPAHNDTGDAAEQHPDRFVGWSPSKKSGEVRAD